MEPLLLDLLDPVDLVRDPREGECGRFDGTQSFMSLLNSLNIFSSPGRIWRAIIGKPFSRSLNDLIFLLLFSGSSFMPGAPADPPDAALFSTPGSVAGVILTGS